jgi:CRISPR-associated protein Cas2
VLVWADPNDLGLDFDTCGVNRRIPVELDGLKLCSFMPLDESVTTRKPDVEATQEDW